MNLSAVQQNTETERVQETRETQAVLSRTQIHRASEWMLSRYTQQQMSEIASKIP